MKVAEITEFEDMRDELEAMSVAEVVIQSIVDETRDPPIAWQSVVILATPDARFFTPWVLAVRPTESDARRAVVELLRGLVVARRAAQAARSRGRRLERRPDDAAGDARGRRLATAPKRRRRSRLRPTTAPSVRLWTTPAVPPPVPRYDEAEYARWRADVRATREQRGLTQAELASRAGTTPSHISRFERDVRRPPLALAQAISDALDLRPPLVAEVPDGAHGADLDTGVLQHSASNGAAAAKRG